MKVKELKINAIGGIDQLELSFKSRNESDMWIKRSR